MPLPSIADAVLTVADLPGPGWTAGPAEPAGGGTDDGLLGAVLEAATDVEVEESADSPVFARPPQGFAYSFACRFRSADEARRVADLLSTDRFVEDLATAVGSTVDAGSSIQFLGSSSRRIAGGPRIVRSTFRTAFAAADGHGVRQVPLDLAVVQTGPFVVLAWLGDGLDGFDPAGRTAVLDALSARLAG